MQINNRAFNQIETSQKLYFLFSLGVEFCTRIPQANALNYLYLFKINIRIISFLKLNTVQTFSQTIKKNAFVELLEVKLSRCQDSPRYKYQIPKQ